MTSYTYFDVKTFYPTKAEMTDFTGYIKCLEYQGVHRQGICRIIPPEDWTATKNKYENLDMVIPSPIKQIIEPKPICGVFEQFAKDVEEISVSDFKKLCETKKYKTPYYDNIETLENIYWTNILSGCPIYGADVNYSLFDSDCNEFNLRKLNTILNLYPEKIDGINKPYLYFGMYKSTFAWHTEDMDLYSINYVHHGAPKIWYVIPPAYSNWFNFAIDCLYQTGNSPCENFIRHKTVIIPPKILTKFNIPHSKIIQNQGQFIITFPYAYHMGFNAGFNIAEAVNFATPRWINYGLTTKQCTCDPTDPPVKIPMNIFTEKFPSESLIPMEYKYPLFMMDNNILNSLLDLYKM